MKIIRFFLFLLAAGCILLSCNRKGSDENNLVTKRIQYDVNIKSPDPDFDWWMQNIEGSGREKLVNDILASVSQGKVKAYDFVSNRLLTTENIKEMMKRVDSVQLERPEPPHELYDTVMVHELNVKEITRLRFLEEWSMEPGSLAFSKKVLGICPMVEAYTESGELKGYKPLFWVFFDEQYPAAFGTVK